MLLVALPLVLAARLRGGDIWHHDRGDQSESSLEDVAAAARSSLETLIHGVEVQMAECRGEDCDEPTARQHAAQLHRYKTALEELAKIEKSGAVSALAKSTTASEEARTTTAKLRTVVLGTELGAQAIARQMKLLKDEQAHNLKDQQRAQVALADATQHLAAAEEDELEKRHAAEVWAIEVQSIARAAQLSDQYADAMYASGVEKFSHARAKEQRAEDLLKKAGKLADRIEGHLTPKPIVESEHDAPSGGGWGAAEDEASTEESTEASTEEASTDSTSLHEETPAVEKATAAPAEETPVETAETATEARIARWHEGAKETKPVPSVEKAPMPAKAKAAPEVPAKNGSDDEMDDIDSELEEIGLPA